jgi:hypothetical protein
MKLNRREFVAAGAASALVPGVLFGATSASLDVAYVNGRVWTGRKGTPIATAIGIAGDRIVAVDDGPVRNKIDKRTRVVDLKGAFVTPGFVDNHTHFLMAAESLIPPNLRDARSPEEFTRRIGEAAKDIPSGVWMQGGSWDEELWGGELPSRKWIDAVTPNTPVAVARYDLHILLLNSVALKLAGITRDTPDPPGGRIVKDANGEPTGVVADAAKDLVIRAIPPPTEAQLEKMLRTGIAYGLKFGVTQAHSMGLDWVTHDALVRLRAKGETDMRFRSYVPLKDWERLAGIVRTQGRGDDWLSWGGLKVVTDGSLGARTALFHRPYTDASHSHGLIVTPFKDLQDWITQADKAGLQIAAHAIGDAANDEVLDIFAEVVKANGERDRRFRIEHAQHLTQAAIPRFGKQHVIASVQPFHAIDDGRWAVNRIGPERLKGTYAFRSLVDAGARVSFGSDWPVAPFNPMTGIAAAVLRQTTDGANPNGWMPEQRVTVEQALTAYTATNAYAAFQEDRFGAIAPGYIADFVVLDNDLIKMDRQKLADVKVLRTVVGGKERFTAGAA